MAASRILRNKSCIVRSCSISKAHPHLVSVTTFNGDLNWAILEFSIARQLIHDSISPFGKGGWEGEGS